MRIRSMLLLAAGLTLIGCSSGNPEAAPVVEATSLLGEPLARPALSDEVRARLQADLSAAQEEYEAAPEDADALIWVGRRHGYLGEYAKSIEVFGEGIERHPDDPRMYRHRGHRYITIREFDRAIEDLERAEELMEGRPIEVEPDGMPNEYGIPTSTLQSNVWYHLALAHYLKGDFDKAVPIYHKILGISTNNDTFVAASDWLYMSYRRLGMEEEAAQVLEPIEADMTILENDAYHQRLLMYKGEVEPESLLNTDSDDPIQFATQGYGVGNWYLYNGQQERAMEIFRQILTATNWAAFGYIAAEAELAR